LRLTHATHLLYSLILTSAEFKRWLEQQGCSFEPGKGSHLKVRLGERSSVLPMHGKTDIGKGLENAIKRQLGLK
jgi:mRNA interferase HicA